MEPPKGPSLELHMASVDKLIRLLNFSEEDRKRFLGAIASVKEDPLSVVEEEAKATNTEDEQLAPVMEGAKVAPILEDVLTHPVVEDAQTAPVIEETPMAPVVEDILTDHLVEDAQNAPVIEDTTTVPVVGDGLTDHVVENDQIAPVTEYVTPVEENVAIATLAEDAQTAPAVEETTKTPVVEDTLTAPAEMDPQIVPVTKASLPVVEDTVIPPTMEDTRKIPAVEDAQIVPIIQDPPLVVEETVIPATTKDTPKSPPAKVIQRPPVVKKKKMAPIAKDAPVAPAMAPAAISPTPTVDDTESDPHVDEPIGESIRIEAGLYFAHPDIRLPDDVYEHPIRCELFGFDLNGYCYIHFWNDKLEEEFEEMLERLDLIYHESRAQEILALSVTNEKIGVKDGEVLVARIFDKSNGGQPSFARIQVIKSLPDEEVFAVNIDNQKTSKIPLHDLYRMIPHFYKFPVMAVKCTLHGLDSFLGKRILYELSQTLALQPEAQVRVESIKGTQYDQIPSVTVYSTKLDAAYKNWSLNVELLQTMATWNKEDLILVVGMVLPNVKVTFANINGEIWVQLQSSIMDQLAKLQPTVDISKISGKDIKLKVLTLLDQGQFTFVAKIDDTYRRVSVTGVVHSGISGFVRSKGGNSSQFRNPIDHETVVVQHTDYGRSEIINLGQLLPFEFFMKELECVPPQIFQAKLKGTTNGVTLKASAVKILMDPHSIVQVQILELAGKLPVVDVFFFSEQRISSPFSVSPGRSRKPKRQLPSFVKDRLPIATEDLKLAGQHFDFNFYRAGLRQADSHMTVLEFEERAE